MYRILWQNGKLSNGEECYTPGTQVVTILEIYGGTKASGLSAGDDNLILIKEPIKSSCVSVAPDDGGVHTTSWSWKFWFYLISEGGSGTNDKNGFHEVAK
ncbi:MAG: hypothetical protein R2852_04605 [Bacteroidia bacterium]